MVHLKPKPKRRLKLGDVQAVGAEKLKLHQQMLCLLSVLMGSRKRIIDPVGVDYWHVSSIVIMALVMEKSAKDKLCMRM